MMARVEEVSGDGCRRVERRSYVEDGFARGRM